MFKYLWHRLISGHNWKIFRVSKNFSELYVLSECQECHNTKTTIHNCGYDELEIITKNNEITIDDLLNKISNNLKG